MARTKQSPEFEIEVDGQPYVWRLHRLPREAKDPAERRGKAIAVRHREGQREAVLEFPPEDQPRYGAPQLKPTQIAPELVATAIGSAITAGWEPLSRGKTVTIVVDAAGG
jgi:hypothetical protein